jgi:hypothetical protein
MEILPKLASYFKLDYKTLEKEFYSERIAEIIFNKEDFHGLLKLAEEKATYFKAQKTYQGTISF